MWLESDVLRLGSSLASTVVGLDVVVGASKPGVGAGMGPYVMGYS